ncbi:CSS-motif domain-containing protein [Pseudomonas sp. PSKL.D1]|uniref:CSS-motif domain-containing protein n=1 Tax=Pseudomonas sp. PSKL.D1 TaxID=3029060 RepID=UPI0023815E82|nr:CSS-motif domain-containing protein [Pseudomonas sp. PSKL.D1]WDY60138.1 CSS-motif domain-containing protein [Pseudomonas sp. PSKL.D1]
MWGFTFHRRTVLELMLTVFISCLPIASGLMVMIYQQDRKLEDNARVSVTEAIHSVDLALERMHTAAVTALPLAQTSCDIARDKLVKLVSNLQSLQGLMLAKDEIVYCSTMPSPLYDSAQPVAFKSPVSLVVDPFSTPNAVLIAYQLLHEKSSVIALAYGLELRNELRAFKDGLILLLEFGDTYITASGDSRDPRRPSQTEYRTTGVSAKFGYTVVAGYPAGYSTQEARNTILQVAPSLALVGIFTGVVFFWGMSNHRIKRGSTAAKNNDDGT